MKGLTSTASAYDTIGTFTYKLPADSWYNHFFGQTWAAGTVTPPPAAASDGVYIALEPMTRGVHTVNYTVSGTSQGQTQNTSVTYSLTSP